MDFKALKPLKSLSSIKPYVEPSFDDNDAGGVDAEIKARVRRPIVVGSWIIGIFVVATVFFMAVAPIDAAVLAPGVIKVEASRKEVRHRDGGVVRQILVREGQQVRAGQPLITLDDVQAKAYVDVLRNQQDAVLAQSARFQAEATGLRTLVLPPELTSRMNDPRVAGLVRDQQFLFASRLSTYESQADVLNQREQQLQTQITGVQSQLDSIDEQIRLTKEELSGYQTLNEKGYAPKTLILRYERTLADLAGRRGALVSEINRLRQQMGETRMQLTTIRQERISQAAEGVRQMQTQLSDVGPKLTAAQQVLDRTVVRSPANGYVLSLNQHTVGGVIAPGELLMSVVPVNEPLIVSARIKPTDIDDVRPGMPARVRLSAFNYRRVSPVEAEVVTVSADQIVDEKTGQGYFLAEIRISPQELAKLPKGAKITPGMPAEAMIVTGRRTILSYVISPFTDTISDALREE
jgi:HlyD family type I secretion membrane fusion protein